MSDFERVVPQVEGYNLVISLPQKYYIDLKKHQNIDEAESYFIGLRDKTARQDRKLELDRIRAILKYASCMGAGLVGICDDNIKRRIKITLGFSTLDKLTEFRDSLETAVRGAIE